ncbi:uncharacterized protein LOC116806329 isoform X2 [Drosophila grimshawi]|uniref:uncharacterized protein LOC116806329 isoform X2 n=1 Tax=Drosophila grimshawi TaxID=7222 RepID=UPI000C870E01|nr:uncharacterized protein LOC116806329 isoform X2 [Drosophila grimshawi]
MGLTYVPYRDVNQFFWRHVPIVGKYMATGDLKTDQLYGYSLFSQSFLNVNFIINGFVLMPAFVQRRLGFLLTIWNFLLFHVIMAMQAIGLWSLKEKIGLYYIILITCGLVSLNAFHLRLITKHKLGFSHSTQKAAVEEVMTEPID